MSFGVGLGSAVPPSSSSLSGLTLGASFPAPSLPLISAPPGFSSSSSSSILPPPLPP